MGESDLKRRNVSRLLVIQNGGVIVQNGMDDDKKKVEVAVWLGVEEVAASESMPQE